ncbi:MAG: acetylglutamate kinase [Euryarchaeota archaeon RBG_16_68_13]|nr:MAG: acetylglutamate kinase [Euryarchaeota archaeon RBG_16_68_13]
MIVVKIGGRDGNDHANLVAGLAGIHPCVVVHGGSTAVDELAAQLGRPARVLTSPSGFTSRHTDGFMIDVVSMAMAGRLNVNLVSALQAAGIPAIGLSGVDGRLVVGRRKAAIRAVEGGKVKVIRDDRSGTVDSVNAALLTNLLSRGLLPVLSPPILDGVEGIPLNADADRIAARVATSMSAEALILLTNVPGLLLDSNDSSSLRTAVSREELPATISASSAGMKKKLLAAQEALDGGVRRVIIADSRNADPVRSALRGEGTVIA